MNSLTSIIAYFDFLTSGIQNASFSGQFENKIAYISTYIIILVKWSKWEKCEN